LLLHAITGAAALVGGRRLGRRALVPAAIAPALTFAWAVSVAPRVLDGDPVTASLRWVPSLDLAIDLSVDAFSLVMVLLVSGIGLAVLIYAWSYLGPDSPVSAKLAGLMTLFAGAMTGVVIADSLLSVYLFWELTSVTSYLLIGIENDRAPARAAARHALLITIGGGLAMLAGFILLGQAAGTFRISEMVTAPGSGTTV